MEYWAVLIAAFVGSTGVIGALTAGVQLSRRARLKRSIETAQKLAGAVPKGSQARIAINQALQTDVLRLAAMSLIELRASARYAIWTIIISVFGGIGVGILVSALLGPQNIATPFDPIIQSMSAEGRAQYRTFVISVLVAMLGFISSFFLALDHRIKIRRERLVAFQLHASNPVIRTRDIQMVDREKRAAARATAKRRLRRLRSDEKALRHAGRNEPTSTA